MTVREPAERSRSAEPRPRRIRPVAPAQRGGGMSALAPRAIELADTVRQLQRQQARPLVAATDGAAAVSLEAAVCEATGVRRQFERVAWLVSIFGRLPAWSAIPYRLPDSDPRADVAMAAGRQRPTGSG